MGWRKGLALCALLPIIALGACGGGGGGGSPGGGIVTGPPPPPPPPPPPGTTVNGFGGGKVIDFTQPIYDASGAGAVFGPVTTTAEMVSIRGNPTTGVVYEISIDDGWQFYLLTESEIDCCRPAPMQGVDEWPSVIVGVHAPVTLAFANTDLGPWDYIDGPDNLNYQTFGYWSYVDVTSMDGGGTFGSFSVGQASPGSAIPQNGSAVFSGWLLGNYIVGLTGTEVAATMTLDVDFVNRTASFSSGNWESALRVGNVTSHGTVYAGTALSGVLTYSSQQNALNGVLTTSNGLLSGPAAARFYGPAAEEVGGEFALTSTTGANERMTGGFGARR
jgi:hypothetical protein